jgi:polyisoprenoid-binding protein YceI
MIPLLVIVALLAPGELYRIDPQKSEVTIDVGKSGALSFVAGHTHVVTGPIQSGTIELDRADPSRSRVRIVIAAAALKVSERNEPAGDVPKIQQTMDGDQVLASDRYRELTFESTSIAVKQDRPPAMDLTIDGRLTIRGVTRPVSVPVRAEFSGDTVRVTGRFSIKQTAFGIKPVTVAGVVSVKDALDISFSIVARR